MPNLVRYSRPTVYAYVPNFIWIGLFCRPLLAKTPNFLPFLDFGIYVVSNWQQTDKVEHCCTTINFPLPNGIKIVSVLRRLHGEIGRKLSDVQKRDEQTDKQTNRQTDSQNNSTFLATPAAGEIPAPPNVAW